MMGDWTAIIKDLGIGGGVIGGMLLALKALKNGKACPAKPILNKFHDEIAESSVVRKGLIEAVNRNTAASERLTDTLVKVLLKEEESK